MGSMTTARNSAENSIVLPNVSFLSDIILSNRLKRPTAKKIGLQTS
jgi:hypothetical protein